MEDTSERMVVCMNAVKFIFCLTLIFIVGGCKLGGGGGGGGSSSGNTDVSAYESAVMDSIALLSEPEELSIKPETLSDGISDLPVAATPEPATMALFSIGVAGFAGRCLRNKIKGLGR